MIEATKRRSYRAALTAVLLAFAATASAQAGSGGISTAPKQSTAAAESCRAASFGERLLELGDCGNDVRTLNWILRAQQGRDVRPTETFARPTAAAVRKIQRRAGLRSSGVVNAKTRKALVKRMRRSVATWYGPGFFGNRTACGMKLKKTTVGVAHRKLPCGTNITIARHGRFVRARVIDRGPYAHGASWDLTQATARKLHMRSTSKVRVAVIR